MAITKSKKEAIVGKFGDVAKEAQSIVFVNFNGLTVGEVTKMRADLRAKGVGYFVSKKTLIERSLTPAYEGTIPSLQTLRGMFVNVINSPIQGLAIALDAIAKKKETA